MKVRLIRLTSNFVQVTGISGCRSSTNKKQTNMQKLMWFAKYMFEFVSLDNPKLYMCLLCILHCAKDNSRRMHEIYSDTVKDAVLFSNKKLISNIKNHITTIRKNYSTKKLRILC